MTTATLETIVEQFSNGVFLAEATINGNTIRNVCLCGNESKNGRTYLPQAFGDGSIYKGRPVMLDHHESAPFARSIRDFAGTVENVTVKNGKPFGDIKVSSTDAGKLLLEIAKAHPHDVGMSHSARGTYSDASRSTVEALEEVVSVDAVMFPATTTTFSESRGIPDIDSIDDVAELKALLTTAIAERNTAFAKLNGEVREIEIYRECAAAGLDVRNPDHVPTWLIETLLQKPSPERRKAIIDDRVQMFAAAAQYRSGNSIITIERTYGSPQQPDSLKAEVDRLFGCPLQPEVDRVFGNGSAEIADDVTRAFGA